jgi:hypothetical protein
VSDEGGERERVAVQAVSIPPREPTESIVWKVVAWLGGRACMVARSVLQILVSFFERTGGAKAPTN